MCLRLAQSIIERCELYRWTYVDNNWKVRNKKSPCRWEQLTLKRMIAIEEIPDPWHLIVDWSIIFSVSREINSIYNQFHGNGQQKIAEKLSVN